MLLFLRLRRLVLLVRYAFRIVLYGCHAQCLAHSDMRLRGFHRFLCLYVQELVPLFYRDL